MAAAPKNSKEKSESINRLACYGFLLFACAIAFIVIGGIGINVIHKVQEWDKSSMYQLHTTCFAVGIPVLIISLVLYYVYRLASNNRQDAVNTGIKWIGLLLFITFICIIFGAFALGNFVTESEIFGNCSNFDNSSTYHFEDVGRLKDITCICILVIVLTFLEILGQCGDRNQNDDLLFSKNGHKKTEATKKLWIIAFFIGCYGLIFVIIFGLSIGYLASESDWNSSKWQQPYYGTIVAAFTTIALSISLFGLHKAAQGNRQSVMRERIKVVNLLMWIDLVGLILCAVFLGNFASESNIMSMCRKEESANDGILIASEKDRNTLRSLSQACIAFLVVTTFLILGQFGERDISKEQLVSVKVDPKPKASGSKPAEPMPSGSKPAENKNSKKTDNKEKTNEEKAKTPNKDASNAGVQKQAEKKEGNKTTQAVGIGIGSKNGKTSDDHIEMLKQQNEHLQEQNALLKQQLEQKRLAPQPLAPIEFMSQIYGQDPSPDTTRAIRPVLVSSEPLPPIPQYLDLTDIPSSAPPSYSEAVSEHEPKEQQKTKGEKSSKC